MRTIPFVLITFVVLSLSPTAARAGDQLQLHLVRAMPRDRVGHLWVLHAKSVPRNGLRERRDLERDADESRSLLPRRAIDPFQQDESVGRMRPAFGCLPQSTLTQNFDEYRRACSHLCLW